MAYSPNRLEHARSLQDQIVAWRRDIHIHPELGFQEYRTAKMVAEALNEMGIEAETGVGITGVVARIGEGKPVIGIRADMDALPIQEENDVDYASQNAHTMHACGHDAHTAILLGVARMLSEMPEEDRPAGEIRLLFQPSEEQQDSEGKSGAMRMIDDGALEGVDHVIALHVASGTESGKIEIRSGYAMANTDAFNAKIIGTGGHGAAPHRGTDPIFMLAQLINAIHGIRARRINPVHPAVISIGAVHAGDACNVIPAEVELNGTIRSYSEEIRQDLHRELEAAFGVVKALGGDYELEIIPGYDATYNDPEVAKLIESITSDMLGADRLEPAEPGMGGEDFGYMTKLAPGAMFYLGAKYDDQLRAHHTPVFNIDESAFPVGAAMLVETAYQLAKRATS
ncbi:MAG: peptidase M20 [Anaerolineaceae bacterium]|nr:peptidase M20 [Anaerolineaceae bacterium]